MPYVTLNLSDKIEMNQFKTESEAHVYCKKGYYPLFIIFKGTIEDAFEDKLERPIAIYVRGQAHTMMGYKVDTKPIGRKE